MPAVTLVGEGHNDPPNMQQDTIAPFGFAPSQCLPLQHQDAADSSTVPIDTAAAVVVSPISASTIIRGQQKEREQYLSDQVTHSGIPRSSNTLVVSTTIVPWTLMSLPEELICRITGFLDVRSLIRLRVVNRHWRHQASSNQAGWVALCENLWRDKIHVCPTARRLLTIIPVPSGAPEWDDPGSLVGDGNVNGHNNESWNDDDVHSHLTIHPNTNAMKAYRLSLHDATTRQYVMLSEFCYNEETRSGTVWSFRFKQSAGADWTAVDPWYSGLPCRKMVFLQDGRVKQYCGVGSSPHDIRRRRRRRTLAASMLLQNPGDDQHRIFQNAEQPQSRLNMNHDIRNDYSGDEDMDQEQGEQLPVLMDPPIPMAWRFLTRPMDLPSRPLGSYVRFSVGGRDVPTYAVRRSPTGNWGFVMESCWGLYASFELPPRRQVVQPARTTADAVAAAAVAADTGTSIASLGQPTVGQQHPEVNPIVNAEEEDEDDPALFDRDEEDTDYASLDDDMDDFFVDEDESDVDTTAESQVEMDDFVDEAEQGNNSFMDPCESFARDMNVATFSDNNDEDNDDRQQRVPRLPASDPIGSDQFARDYQYQPLPLQVVYTKFNTRL